MSTYVTIIEVKEVVFWDILWRFVVGHSTVEKKHLVCSSGLPYKSFETWVEGLTAEFH